METLRYHHPLRVLLLVALCLIPTMGQAQEHRSDALDDVLEYIPYASVFALKACGVSSRDDWPKLALTTAASWVVSAGAGYVLKHSIHEWRPDHSDRKSFPSGHALIAFAGATALHYEFHHVSPWISVSAYTLATAVAVDRVVRDRHHWYDVAAGAGIGVCATAVTWWVSDRIIKNDRVQLGFTGNRVDLAIRL